MKKAQITMETLLLYGVAILIVLLAVAALMYFGVLDLGGMLPEKCTVGSDAGLKCEEYKVHKGASEINLALRNTGAKTIDIINASFESADTGAISDCAAASGPDILPGTLIQVDLSSCTVTAEVGKRVKGKVTLVTQFKDGLLDQTTTGDLLASVS